MAYKKKSNVSRYRYNSKRRYGVKRRGNYGRRKVLYYKPVYAPYRKYRRRK